MGCCIISRLSVLCSFGPFRDLCTCQTHLWTFYVLSHDVLGGNLVLGSHVGIFTLKSTDYNMVTPTSESHF